MPNWCSNRLTIEGDPAVLTRLAIAAENGELLQYIDPMPKALKRTTKGFLGVGDEQLKLERQQRANVEKYGYPTWYEFANERWGTKWDVGEAEVCRDSDNRLTMLFTTAWGPPTGAYITLNDMTGIDSVEATWFEMGMSFCGVYMDGAIYDKTIDEFTEEWINDNLPPLILKGYADEIYSIIEMNEEFNNE